MDREQYRYLYDEFEMYYKNNRIDVIDWKPIGKNMIVIYYDNGVKSFYDGNTQTVHSVHPRSSGVEFIDDEIYIRRFTWRLSAAIGSSGLSRNEIAERTGISKASLSGYLNGKAMPSILNIYKLARVLKCPIEDLLGVDEWDL
jgi:DNA-binding XRE family transcriptional regulator